MRQAWCKVNTHHKKLTRGTFMKSWDQVSHITTYTRRLYKQHTQLLKYGLPTIDAKKTQQYTEQMYAIGIFIGTDLRKWEKKTRTDTIWITPKSTSTKFTPRNTRTKTMWGDKEQIQKCKQLRQIT